MAFLHPRDDEISFFSTHAWAHLHRRDGLHTLLDPWRKGRDFFDLSVTSRHPLDTDTNAALGAELRDRIEVADMLLIMAGMYLIDREWMEFEIITAHALRKPIIPIAFNGQERIPEFARRYAWCEPVRWRGDSIRAHILHFLPEYRRQAFLERRAREAAVPPRPRLLAPPPYRAPNALAPDYGRGRAALTAGDFLDSYATPNAFAPFPSVLDQVWNPPANGGGVFGAWSHRRLK
jgi:hypothetical protein